MKNNDGIRDAPKGLVVLTILGPSFVWCAEYIGSGEVILAPRMGAVLGYAVLWAPIAGIILKFFIGLSGARYTICTGEGMIDMFSRIPVIGKSAVWIILITMFIIAAIAIGSLATAASVFANSIFPINQITWGWIISIFAIIIVWSGKFDIIKYVMSVLVLFIMCGAVYIAIHTFPGFSQLLKGITGFEVPEYPHWAKGIDGLADNPWNEILPLLGWAAGGFASQVWYTYWVLGAGFGMTRGRKYGEPCDTEVLKNMTVETAKKVKGWCNIVSVDATIALMIGIVTTASFMMAGAGILRPEQIAPEGNSIAIELSNIFGKLWGNFGAYLFMVAGFAALISTVIGHFAGWPRLLSDSLRICVPKFNKLKWKIQYRIFVIICFITNIVIIFSFQFKPLLLLKIAAISDGLLFVPLQAVFILIGLFWVLPKLIPTEAWKILKPHWIYIVGLIAAAIVFGYFSIFQIPKVI